MLADRRYHADHFKFPRSMPTSKSSEITLQSILFILGTDTDLNRTYEFYTRQLLLISMGTEQFSKFLSFTARIPTSVEPKVPCSSCTHFSFHNSLHNSAKDKLKKKNCKSLLLILTIILTRKHSSKMRTVRCSDRRGGGGGYLPGGVPGRWGVPAWGVPAREVYLPRGVYCPGGCSCPEGRGHHTRGTRMILLTTREESSY